MSARAQLFPSISVALNWLLLNVRHEFPRCVIFASSLFILVCSCFSLALFLEHTQSFLLPSPDGWFLDCHCGGPTSVPGRSVWDMAHKVAVVQDFCSVATMDGKHGTPVVTSVRTSVSLWGFSWVGSSLDKIFLIYNPVLIYRVIKKSLCIWWLQYRK
jgi:hypothetical protein